MTKLQYSGNLTTSRRVQIEEQAFRHAEQIVGWFSYCNSNFHVRKEIETTETRRRNKLDSSVNRPSGL